jgi:hemerythrin-like domain-containing protein
MIEHRLIERMIKLMKEELLRGEEQKKVNPRFIETVTDFIRAYADRCHHGKEEDILFRELKKKTISPQHEKTMDELIEEHKWGRETTRKLVEANFRYMKGDRAALPVILGCIRSLASFYPKHIEKEDKHFFVPVMGYFTKEEREAMLKEGYEFDGNLLHQEYQDIVNKAEKAAVP